MNEPSFPTDNTSLDPAPVVPQRERQPLTIKDRIHASFRKPTLLLTCSILLLLLILTIVSVIGVAIHSSSTSSSTTTTTSNAKMSTSNLTDSTGHDSICSDPRFCENQAALPYGAGPAVCVDLWMLMLPFLVLVVFGNGFEWLKKGISWFKDGGQRV